MAEMKDPGFKLFGKTIPMHQVEDRGTNSKSEQEGSGLMKDAETQDIGEENSPESEDEAVPDGNPEEVVTSTGTDDSTEEDCKKKEIPTMARENELKDKKGEGAAAETNGNEGKMPKKPDRLLPCPRCDSLDTKFCYYNNYNVNQPRHFCKNCQRYWTAGGTMRNVPVGAGRRKNKHSASHYRHMMMSDGLTTARADAPDAAHHPVIPSALSPSARALKASRIQFLPVDMEATGGTVLNFGPETPLCESIATALNLADQAMVDRKVFKNKDDDKGSVSCGENRDDISCGSSITASPCAEKEEGTKNYRSVSQMEQGGLMGWPHGVPQQPYYGGGPWSYGWNFGWGGAAGATAGACSNGTAYGAENSSPNTGGWNNGPLGAPGMWAAGIPWPFIPASYWGGPASWGGTAWNMPWPASPGTGLSSSPSSSNGSGSGSPTLGKHSRDIAHLEGKTDGCLWVPKTLRIDDPGEAARSSIWTTLGIGNKPESITTGGIFKAFQPKTEDKESIKASAPGLLANPAALSRSIAFQESN